MVGIKKTLPIVELLVELRTPNQRPRFMRVIGFRFSGMLEYLERARLQCTCVLEDESTGMRRMISSISE